MAAAAVAAPALVQWGAVRALNARGLGPASIDVVQASLWGVEARAISLAGGAARIGLLRADYAPGDLLQRRVARLTVHNAEIALAWDGSNWRLGETVLGPSSPGEPGAPGTAESESKNRPPLDALVVDAAKLRLTLQDRAIDTVLGADLAAVGPGSWQGTLQAAISGEGVSGALSWSGLAAGSDLAAWRGTGSVSADVARLPVGNALTNLDVALSVQLTATEAQTTINGRFARPLVAALGPAAVESLASIWPGFEGAAHASFVLSGRNGSAFSAERAASGDGSRWTIDAVADATLDQARLRTVIDGWIHGQDLAFPELSLAVSKVPYGDGRLSASVALTEITGPAVIASGEFTLAADAQDIADISLSVPEARLTGRGDWRLDGLSLSFDFADLTAAATDLVVPGVAALPGAQTVHLAADNPRRQLNVVFGNAVSIAADLDVSVPLSIRADAMAMPITVALPRVGVSGYATPGDGYRFAVTAEGGKIGIGPAIAVVPDFAVTATPGGLAGRIDGRLVAAGAASATGALAALPDTSLAFRATLNATPEKSELAGELLTATGALLGTFSVSQPANEPLDVALDVPETRFGPGATAWNDVAGSLLPIDRVEGRVAVSARARSTAQGFAGTMQLSLDDLDFDLGTVRVRGVAGAVALDQPWPPRAAASQTLTFQSVDITPPVTDGRIVVGLPGDGTMSIDSFAADFAGGTITGEPAVIHLDGRPSNLVLTLNGARIDRLLAAASTDGLTGTGTISGEIPLEVRDGGLFITQAELTGREGTVAYRPVVAPAALAGGGDLVLQALTDFRFEELRANIDGNALEDLNVAVKLKGRNPSLYGGYPIEFNLNLDGPLARIATDSLAGYRIPDEIKRRMEQSAIEQNGVNGAGAAAPPP
ncbi:MAG: YdbH domain-containing protein [Rhodospirillaceae bacterium]|nr:YdbH domain-containing protein [Rhodospirillaceae bacterium]